jgi:carbon-monoxide dehydrogenase medium subunit
MVTAWMVRPESVEEVDACRQEYPEHVLLAGGTLTVPALHKGNLEAPGVIDLSRAGLAYIRPEGDELRIGAMTTYADVVGSEPARDHAPLLVRMAQGITGGMQITGQGTLGGSACAGRPHSDFPAVACALDATVVIRGGGTERTVPMSGFLQGAQSCDLAPHEFVVEFRLPRPVVTESSYHKLKFAAGTWPIVTAATTVEARDDGATARLRLTLGGVGDIPLTVRGDRFPMDDLLREDSVASVLRALEAASAAYDGWWSDVYAPGDYRKQVAPHVARRSLNGLEATWGRTA